MLWTGRLVWTATILVGVVFLRRDRWLLVRSGGQPKAQAVTRRIGQILFDTDVMLARDQTSMAQRKLNLLDGRFSFVSKTGESSSQIVRNNSRLQLASVALDGDENALGAHAFAGYAISLVHREEDAARLNTSSPSPIVERFFRP